MDEVDQLKITLEGYRERLINKVITLEVGMYDFERLINETYGAKDGESLLAIAFCLAYASRDGFSEKAFRDGRDLLSDIKATTHASTAPQLKLAFEEGKIYKRSLIDDADKKIAREALEIILGKEAVASC